jgi:acetolactate synthase regulatory subunit
VVTQERIVVYVDDTPDALVRILVAIHRRGIRVTGAHMGSPPPTAVKLDVEGTTDRLGLLARRLETLPFIASVERGQASAETSTDSTVIRPGSDNP